jgi:acyl carrier protein
MGNFYERMAEILEVDQVQGENILEDFETWDSLGALSVVSMVDEIYGVMISGADIKKFNTVGDIEDFIKMNMVE